MIKQKNMFETFALILIVFTTFSVSADDLIPVVSASIAKAGLQSKAKAQAQEVNTSTDKSEYVITPGTNEIIKVAVTHLNRFVTPFENPEILTQATRIVSEVSENVVYIGTDEQGPLTVFIKEKGSEEQAISLTLIPLEIPPREITLKFPIGNSVNYSGTSKAKKWEESQPYVSTIEMLMKTIALGDVPRGYKISESPEGSLPACRQTGLSFNFKNGQSLIGSHLDVQIGVITNITNTAIEFVEDTCGDWNVAAVSVFPHHVLEPNQKTEVYVVVKKNLHRETTQKRKSLVQ